MDDAKTEANEAILRPKRAIMDTPDLNVNLSKIDHSNATLLLAAKNNALLQKILHLLVDVKAELSSQDKKELLRITLIQVKEELVKVFDNLPPKQT